MKKNLIFSCLLLLILTSCNLPQDNPAPEGKPGALYTEAAQTLSVKLTEEGINLPPKTQTPETSNQKGTQVPLPSDTFVVPSFTPQDSAPTESKPCDQVRFIKDVTIPDEMDLAPGESFTKTWRLQNAGSCPWTIGYLLYFDSGDLMGGPSSKQLTNVIVQPDDTIDVSVELVAPSEIGTYQGNWKLRNVKGDSFGIGEFGKAFWVKINVVEGAGLMQDLKAYADNAAWGSGKTPVDFIDLGDKIINFESEGDPGDPYVAVLDEVILEGGRISGVLLATYPPIGKGRYLIGRFPDYKVNAGDLLRGRIGLEARANGDCGNGDVDFRIHLMRDGNPANMVMLGEWNETCDKRMKDFEIDLDNYKGETVQIFLVVIANNDSSENQAVWDIISIHR